MKCLYLEKKLTSLNKLLHVFFLDVISNVVWKASLNSFVIIVLVDLVTLKVEFCSGKAGVIIGIK